ncbi:hypothetical protein [Limnoglobus roseus]|nr:hypothetical protein [Limnoglobus roseus]
MSLTRCAECDTIHDTDEHPEGYYDQHGKAREYLCEWCATEEDEEDEL